MASSSNSVTIATPTSINTVAAQPLHFIRATQSAPNTPAKLTAVIRAQQPASSIVATSIAATSIPRSPVIQHHPSQPQKVHIQAGQHHQQQSIVLPARTTPLTTQGNVSAAVTSVSFPVTSQHLTTPALPTHPAAAGTIQTVKIGGGQAQASLILKCVFWFLL